MYSRDRRYLIVGTVENIHDHTNMTIIIEAGPQSVVPRKFPVIVVVCHTHVLSYKLHVCASMCA